MPTPASRHGAAGRRCWPGRHGGGPRRSPWRASSRGGRVGCSSTGLLGGETAGEYRVDQPSLRHRQAQRPLLRGCPRGRGEHRHRHTFVAHDPDQFGLRAGEHPGPRRLAEQPTQPRPPRAGRHRRHHRHAGTRRHVRAVNEGVGQAVAKRRPRQHRCQARGSWRDGAQGGEEPGQDLTVEIRADLAVPGGEAVRDPPQFRQRDADRGHQPTVVVLAQADFPPHRGAQPWRGRPPAQQQPQFTYSQGPVRQARMHGPAFQNASSGGQNLVERDTGQIQRCRFAVVHILVHGSPRTLRQRRCETRKPKRLGETADTVVETPDSDRRFPCDGGRSHLSDRHPDQRFFRT
ncbi:hypothetical protein FAGKG844_290053 [Frankia sp. AgKG'84/4]